LFRIKEKRSPHVTSSVNMYLECMWLERCLGVCAHLGPTLYC
jgi:hypothetical protein